MRRDYGETEIQETARQWRRLKEQAESKVRAGAPQDDRKQRSRRLLQILYLPAFDAPVSWELFEVEAQGCSDATSYVANRTAWMQFEDMRAFEAPNAPSAAVRRRLHGIEEPTIARSAATLEAAPVQDALTRLSQIQIPIQAPPAAMGLDGWNYELHLGDFWAGLTLRWWVSAPTEWKPVEDWMHALREHLEARFDEGSKAESKDADFPAGGADV